MITTTDLDLPPRGTNLNEWIDDLCAKNFGCDHIGAGVAANIARAAALFLISDRAKLITNLANFVHRENIKAGWWNDLHTGCDLHGQRNMGEMLMLVVTEVSEAMEGWRKDLMDTKLLHRPMLRVELIDALIRILDILGSEQNREHPAGDIFEEKLEFNRNRDDHKLENRRLAGGKKV